MENNSNVFDFLEIIRKVKRVDNFNMALMGREELKAYLVAQMEEIEKNYKRFCQCFSGMISDYNRDCFVWDKSKDPHEMSNRLIAECKERGFEVNFE